MESYEVSVSLMCNPCVPSPFQSLDTYLKLDEVTSGCLVPFLKLNSEQWPIEQDQRLIIGQLAFEGILQTDGLNFILVCKLKDVRVS